MSLCALAQASQTLLRLSFLSMHGNNSCFSCVCMSPEMADIWLVTGIYDVVLHLSPNCSTSSLSLALYVAGEAIYLPSPSFSDYGGAWYLAFWY